MKSRLPFIFVVLTVILDAMGIGLILPIMPDLVRELTGGTISDAALWGGALAVTYAAMQFVFSPILGGLSDRFGRRPVLLLSLVAMGIDYLLMGLAPTIWLLFVARTISGITGATYATANAVVADISPPERRGANFGIVGAAFGLGFVLGPVIGGQLGALDPRAPFFVAGALALGNALFGYLVAPETLPPARRRPFRLREANPVGALLRVRALPGIGALITVLLIYMIASNVYPVIWSYYTMEKFGWSTGLVGASLAYFGICMALVQGGLIRLLLARFPAGTVAGLGLGLNLLAFSLLVWVPSTTLLFILMPLAALGVIVTPAMQALLTNLTSDDRQGELQGVIASLGALAAIVTPATMQPLFYYFTSPDTPVYLPSAPFAASALLIVLAMALFWRARAARPAPQT